MKVKPGGSVQTVKALIALFCLIIAGGGGPGPAMAQGASPHIAPSLDSESASPAPGRTMMLAIRMTAEPGWHGYWTNPGDVGLPAVWRWHLPPGVTLGPAQWPTPTLVQVAGIASHAYPGSYAILFPLTLSASVRRGTALPIRLQGEWLACTDRLCVPERGGAQITLVAGDGHRDGATRIDADRAALPVPLGTPVRMERRGDQVRLAIPWPSGTKVGRLHLFAADPHALDGAAPQQFVRQGDLIVADVKAGRGNGSSWGAGTGAGGQIVLGMADAAGAPMRGFDLTLTPGPVPEGGTPLVSAGALADAGGSPALPLPSTTAFSVLWALLGAIAGGLILNLMPCVFPILSLKVLALARAGGEARLARAEALGYTIGAVAFTLLLGAVILALRAGGEAVGWAFQLQDSRVVLVLLVLVVGITLNLADGFQLPMLGGQSAAKARPAGHPLIDGVVSGALAAVIATPCAGPFMGVALGTALLLPAPAALAVFAGLGFGLALPFLVIGWWPGMRRLLPRPGPWMAWLRHGLAVPMALTALGLLWLLGRLAGGHGWLAGVTVAIGTGMALLALGRAQRLGQSLGRAIALGVGVLVVSVAMVLPAHRMESRGVADPAGLPFDPARLDQLRREGRPVFLYFTADWCLSCKVNERVAIERPEVRAAFRNAQVTVMVGDWTLPDPVITRFLDSQGRSGVPLYLLYPKGQGAPEILPQILTPGLLIDQVRTSANPNP